MAKLLTIPMINYSNSNGANFDRKLEVGEVFAANGLFPTSHSSADNSIYDTVVCNFYLGGTSGETIYLSSNGYGASNTIKRIWYSDYCLVFISQENGSSPDGAVINCKSTYNSGNASTKVYEGSPERVITDTLNMKVPVIDFPKYGYSNASKAVTSDKITEYRDGLIVLLKLTDYYSADIGSGESIDINGLGERPIRPWYNFDPINPNSTTAWERYTIESPVASNYPVYVPMVYYHDCWLLIGSIIQSYHGTAT